MHNIDLYIAKNLKDFLNIIHVWNVYTFRNNTVSLLPSFVYWIYRQTNIGT
jgi:hypothetical protein